MLTHRQTEVPPKSLTRAINHLRNGGTLVIPSYTHWVRITRKTLERFEKAGSWLLKEDGNGYRVRSGKSSYYVFPGQLHFGPME